ncbi:hypothetical protein AB0J83_31010 [Actinoplanes sp. NPDC049596]|uniref:hypothetical protein n=1 Tax=unclassified Actinoplanes TaxID=2626549 RepID=UPI00341335C3
MSDSPADEALRRIDDLLASTMQSLESLVDLRATLTGGHPVVRTPVPVAEPDESWPLGVLAVDLVQRIRARRKRLAVERGTRVQMVLGYTQPGMVWDDLRRELVDPEFRAAWQAAAAEAAAIDEDAAATIALAARVAPWAARQTDQTLPLWTAWAILTEASRHLALLDGSPDHLDDQDAKVLEALRTWHDTHTD